MPLLTQLITNYLVNQIITVLIGDTDSLTTGTRVVFAKPIKIYKNIDNTLELRYVSRDEKRVSIHNKNIKFYIIDQNAQQVVAAKNGITLDDGATVRYIGRGTVTILGTDLIDLPVGFYNFSTKLVNAGDVSIEAIGYVDDNYGATGTLQIIDGVYPDIDGVATDTVDEYDLGSITGNHP
jgi:hypothetical protein